MSRRDKRFLALAAQVAAGSTHAQRHGAVVVRSGNVIARGVNCNKNDPANIPDVPELVEKISVHAEVAALRRVKRPRGCTIYIARVRPEGKLGLSKPCANCESYLRQLRVKVVYTMSED